MIEKLPFAALIIAIIYMVLFVLNIWTSIFDVELFFKLTVTFGVVLMAIVAVFLVVRELSTDKKLKKDKYMD